MAANAGFSTSINYRNYIINSKDETCWGSNGSKITAYKDARKLAAIALVAAGYAGDMDEELCNELLDDMDYHFNKVKCRKIEMMMPQLMGMVESEMDGMR